MGGRMQHRQSGLWGGLLGGIIITLLLLMINLGLVTEFEHIQSVALPTLLLASHISPLLGTVMSIIMVLVIYNTIVGLMYAFASQIYRAIFQRVLCTHHYNGYHHVYMYIYRFHFFNWKSLPNHGII